MKGDSGATTQPSQCKVHIHYHYGKQDKRTVKDIVDPIFDNEGVN